jgi:beta-glucosidase
MCLQDAGNGVRNTDFVSSFASGIHVGASWNKTLAYDRANALGHEFRRKGVNIALGPVVGPLGRLATGGRDWEGASNDPYLAGVMAGETVKGIQDAGVMTSLKVC